MLDLAPEALAMVQQILRHRVPQLRVLAFGSRVNGRARRFSDLDLALIGNQPMAWQDRADLAEEFSESDLPVRVDIVDLNTASPDFRETVLASCVTIQEPRPSCAADMNAVRPLG